MQGMVGVMRKSQYEELRVSIAEFKALFVRFADYAMEQFEYLKVTKADRAELAVVQGDTATLKSDSGTLKTDVATLKTDVATLKTDVVTLKADVSTLKTDVGILKTDVATLKTDMASIKKDLAATKEDMAEGFSRIQESMASKVDIERILAVLDAQSKYFQEQDMMKGHLDRHDRWIHRIAGDTGTKLEY